jgi:hypothetical protein
MSYSLILSVHAETEILEAIRWYNGARENLGFDFYEKLSAKFSIIVKAPLHYSIRFNNLRAATVSNFPFLIYYKVIEKESSIIIVGVLHTSRNQKQILKRK